MQEAVTDVDPNDSLDKIHERLAAPSLMSRVRAVAFIVGVAIVSVAATVGIAIVTTPGERPHREVPTVATPTSTPTSSATTPGGTPSPSPSRTPSAPSTSRAPTPR